tara:strand:- start:342 stop:668 length:327 start_codon:yes stop_codon:yes gene_type:complete
VKREDFVFSGGGTTAAVGSSGTLSIGSSAHNSQQLYDKIDSQEKLISQQSAEIKVLKEKLNQMQKNNDVGFSKEELAFILSKVHPDKNPNSNIAPKLTQKLIKKRQGE